MFRMHYAVLTGALVLCATSFASSPVCPKLSLIKAAKVTFVEKLAKGYSVYQLSTYKTNQNWSFVLYPITADSENQALLTGNAILSKMTKPGVMREGDNYCSYETDSPFITAKAFHYD